MAATPAEFCSTMRSVLLTNEEGKTRKLSHRVSTSGFHSRTRARAGIPDHNHEARQGRGTSPIPSGPISFVVEIYHGPPRLPFWQRSHGGRGGGVSGQSEEVRCRMLGQRPEWQVGEDGSDGKQQK